VRQREEQELADGGGREGALDDHPGEVEEVPHQDDEGVEGEAEHRRRDHFLEDVAGEDLHEQRRDSSLSTESDKIDYVKYDGAPTSSPAGQAASRRRTVAGGTPADQPARRRRSPTI